MTTATFFKLQYDPLGDRLGAPLAHHVHVPTKPLDWHSLDGERAVAYGGGPAEVIIESGKYWTDAIEVVSLSWFIVNYEVIASLAKAGVTGFEPFKCVIANVHSAPLRAEGQPDYFYLSVSGHIDIDWHASGANPGNVRRPYLRLVPRVDTWDGSDLFVVRTPRSGPTSQVFCTQKVLDLAHQYRWTNFLFQPMDVLQRYDGRIDYLAKEWPPKSWYPTPPSAGKALSEWIEVLLADPYVGKASIPLLDFGHEAVGPLLALLDNPSLTPLQRYNVAHALRGFQTEFSTALPLDGLAKVERALAIDVMAHVEIPPPPGVSPE